MQLPVTQFLDWRCYSNFGFRGDGKSFTDLLTWKPFKVNLLRRDFLQFISGLWVECDLRCHYILDAQNWIINPIHGTHLEHAAYVLGKIQEGHFVCFAALSEIQTGRPIYTITLNLGGFINETNWNLHSDWSLLLSFFFEKVLIDRNPCNNYCL